MTVLAALAFLAAPAAAQFELVIGEEHFYPGVVMIFEGAVRDHVLPAAQHLEEEKTHVHIEARANWHEDESRTPDGTPPGGFVAYMTINAEIMNEVTGAVKFATPYASHQPDRQPSLRKEHCAAGVGERSLHGDIPCGSARSVHSRTPQRLA